MSTHAYLAIPIKFLFSLHLKVHFLSDVEQLSTSDLKIEEMYNKLAKSFQKMHNITMKRTCLYGMC